MPWVSPEIKAEHLEMFEVVDGHIISEKLISPGLGY